MVGHVGRGTIRRVGRETGELSTSLEAMVARIVKNLCDLGYD